MCSKRLFSFVGIGSDVKLSKYPKKQLATEVNGISKEGSWNTIKSEQPVLCASSPSGSATQSHGTKTTELTNLLDKSNSGRNPESNLGAINRSQQSIPDPPAQLYHKHKAKTKHQGKEKRRKKDAKFEGERISHLVKQKPFNKEVKEEQEDNRKTSDEYVLEKLLKKSGRCWPEMCIIFCIKSIK